MLTKESIKALQTIAIIFALFVPWGYLPWFWATPITLLAILYYIGMIMGVNE